MVKNITQIISELTEIKNNYGDITTDDNLDLYDENSWIEEIESNNTNITELVDILLKLKNKFGDLTTDIFGHQSDLDFYNGEKYIASLFLEEIEDK